MRRDATVKTTRLLAGLTFTAVMFHSVPAHASIFQGETLDAVANALAWVVLFVVPIVAITVFWLVHILPEKIAEKRHHPQAQAIHTLCLLSLFFGGLLWPLAWLWAYSKPVLYKMAYGTDKVVHGDEEAAHPPPEDEEALELKRLRERVAELEARSGGRPAVAEGKA
jgi:CBS domain containing-hemolysin-like protein